MIIIWCVSWDGSSHNFSWLFLRPQWLNNRGRWSDSWCCIVPLCYLSVTVAFIRGSPRLLQDPNPFLSPSMEPDALLRSTVPPLPNKEQGRLGGSGRSLAPLHFPSELLPFDEALRDVCTIRPLMEGDVVARHGGQLLDIKATERRGKYWYHF